MKGHHVEVWEKDKDIGGTLDLPLAYEPNSRLLSYLKIL